MRNAEFEKRLRLMLSSNETKCAGTMAAASTELEAQREVQALLDAPHVRATKGGSGVVERLQERQRERHQQLVSELQKELSAISEILETEVRESGERLKHKLENSLHNMEAALATITDGDHLSSLRLDNVKGVWQGVESQFDLRLGFIETLGHELAAAEDRRSHKVCECLRRYTQLLVGVAYCSGDEVTRQVEEEAHSLNMTILANRRSAAQLCSQLAAGERSVWGEMRERWGEGVERWRQKVLRDTLLLFRAHVGVEDGEEGVGGGVERLKREAERVKKEMIDELSRLQQRKLELLAQLSTLGPSHVVMEMLHQLGDSAQELDQQISICVEQGLLRLGHVGEQLVGACEAQMEVCKVGLLDSGVCDQSSVYQVLNSDYLPLTERLAENGRSELQNIEMAVEAHIAQHQSWFQSVLQYGMGVGQLWRDHSSALAEVRRSREEALERLRVEHDIRNQNVEANLDMVLDHMRQAPNEQVLDKCLEEANALLDVISGGYKEFHEVLSEQVRAGPETVARCLLDYDTALCGYLGVARNPPPSSPRTKKGKVVSRAKAGSKKSKKATPTDPAPKPSVAGIVEEVVVRGGAVRFYVVGVPETESDSTGVFLTQNEESEGAPHGIANQALPLSREKYTQARASLRVVYLDHLEMWRGEVGGEEEREAREKEEEACGELDLRMHLHHPRQSRISRDIQRVRAAELEAHRDRIGRHARAVASGISEVRACAGAASDSMRTEEDEYRQKMEDLARSLAQMTSSVGLQQVERKTKHLLEKRLERVEKIGSEVKTSIQTSLSELSSTNTAFRASLKLFSEAGNYCPEEVELFSHRLERSARKLSGVEPQVLATVAQASSAHSQAATDTFSQFYNLYHLHWTDVCHLEEVKKSLTFLQLSVRSVVADSNLQASRLHDGITRTREQLESGDHAHLLEGVPLRVTLLTQRIVYLHCRATVQQGGRVGTTLRQGGRVESQQKQPISAVNVSQSIRDHTRAGGGKVPAVTSSSSGHQPPSRTEGSRTLSRKKAAQALVERKNINFGVGGGEDWRSCFLPQIRALLSSSYSHLYTTTEVYYTGKGSRPVVCQLLSGTCEEALDKLIETCQGYRRQCEDYRNNAISEFRSQLEALLALLVGVASQVMGGIRAAHMAEWEEEWRETETCHQRTMHELAVKKESHERCLEPSLGHPGASQQLTELSTAEEARHALCLDHISSHSASLQVCVKKVSRKLAAELATETQRLLDLYDTVPTTNEIIPGNEETPEQLPVDQLLRLKLRPADDVITSPGPDEGVTASSSQACQWPGLSLLLLERVGLEPEEAGQLGTQPHSRKSSEAHQAVITARDRELEGFVKCVEEGVGKREREEREERGMEERCRGHWTQSLHSLTQLYS